MSITLTNITKSFDIKKVIDNFSLEIADGSKLCIMGESGSGKTTLINMIAGLVKPDAGVISIPPNSRIGFVFQENRLVESLTVYRNIKTVCGNNITRKSLGEALNSVGLDEKLVSAKVCTLSGGMKRRVAILRALLFDADILIMDEPTKGLDDDNRAVVLDYILNKAKNKTLIWVTHDRKEAEYVSDRIIQL